jgi:hypothetical protein
VLKRGLYLIGRILMTLVMFVGFLVPMLAYGGESGVQEQPLPQLGTLFLAMAAGVVVHELGHLLAGLAVGAKIIAFRIGGKKALIRFRAGPVKVSLGWPYGGRVSYADVLSIWRLAVVTLAGPLADLALAGLVLAGAAAVASGRALPPLSVLAADGLALIGLCNLMPYRTRSGDLTDGAQLFELRSVIAAAQLATARQASLRLLQAGRVAELLELHTGLDVPAGRLSTAQAVSLALAEFYVALLPGRLPDDAALLAERRLAALARQPDLGHAEPVVCVTQALLRLRRGDAQGHAETERLCERALARKDVTDYLRGVALAAVMLSRQARGLPDADLRATAADMPTGESRPVAMAAELSARFDPEAALRAFRHGDPAARRGLASIATALRRQGRARELLELHAGSGRPAGPGALEEARSLETLEYNVLLLPDLPSQVQTEAASRVQWIVANYPYDQRTEPVHHAALEHTLALARLRQGRFGEIEPLCASALAADVGKENRATVLATIALARSALGQPHADVLAEAVALSPDADLVAEAQRIHPVRESQPQPSGMN